ncbi:MAG: hypothetical protein FGM33_09565 [Candidatus Kapabacteria bacterium]|nr:hypothetical protein [Candidatus Kapabacteria bacterium]
MIRSALLLFVAATLYAAPGSEYLRVNFTRSLYPPSSPPEIVQGNIYYSQQGAVHIEITSPVNQLITMTGKEMQVYYPKERKAFVFQSDNPLTLPFASAFLSSTRESFGLPEIGFTVESVQRSGDSVISSWRPPPAGRGQVEKIVLTEVKGDIVKTESYAPKAKLSTRTLYKSYVGISQGRVPLEIYGGWQTPKGWTKENLSFSGPTTITSLPANLNEFKIPADVVPRRSKW